MTQTNNTYCFTLTERNGEQEYSWDYLVYAETIEDANAVAHDYANNWYDQPDDNGNQADAYDKENDYFDFDVVIITITPCKEIAPAVFTKELVAQHTLRHRHAIRTLEQLKAFAIDGFECFIALNFGGRSSKHITYQQDTHEFIVDNYIDGSTCVLTEAEIMDSKLTNIGEAMAKGALIAD